MEVDMATTIRWSIVPRYLGKFELSSLSDIETNFFFFFEFFSDTMSGF